LIEQLFYKSNEPLKAIHSLLWLIVLYTLTLKKRLLINHQNMWDTGDEIKQTTLPSRGSRTCSERQDGHRGEMKHGMGTLSRHESLCTPSASQSVKGN